MAATARNAADPTTRILALQQALESGVRATRTAEDLHNAWYNLAALYASQNDHQRTEESLRAAIRSSPDWFKPHWTLAQVWKEDGRRAEACAEASIAADLDGGKNPEVAQTRRQICRQEH
jgi:tetratricopeptide (TPR) repeat protein